MAARPQRLIAILAAIVVAAAGSGVASRGEILRASGTTVAPAVAQRGAATTRPAEAVAIRRIVSLVPALTEMLFAIGAGPQVVAVSSFDAFPPEVATLPRVGALLDPDTERILALRPDLVIVYSSRSDVEAQFRRAGIRTFNYRHGGIPTVLETITDLGAATGHAAAAQRVVRDLQGHLDAVRRRIAGRPRVRTMLVIDRQPKTLRDIYVSGGIGFLHEVLQVSGGANVFADAKRESVQPSLETILTRAPEVILELRAQGLLEANDGDAGARNAWSALSALPAVRNDRVRFLTGAHLVVPGPRLGLAADTFARALHPEAYP